MATYIVQPNQNIFDISLQLYGTIEGIFDLLITNSGLSMNIDLVTGQELEYHEDFILNSTVVDGLSSDSIIPANGERHVYHKVPTESLLVLCDVSETLYTTSFIVGGEGTMIVDWGDNSELEYIQLSHTNQTVEHYFDSTVETKRRIRIYGDSATMKLTYWDTSTLGGALIVVSPIVVDEYVSQSNGYDLTGLALFEGTYKIDLQKSTVNSLLPIGDMNLQELNLLQVRFSNSKVVSEYLQYVVNNYGTRRGCTVYLDEVPGNYGPVNTLLKKNTGWKFIMNGVTYTKPVEWDEL
jgi:hypothetical protein